MEEKKKYVGSGKQVHENIINISICLTDLPREFINQYEGKKYIRLTVMKKKEVDKWGKTHSVTVDTWKPEKKSEPNFPQPVFDKLAQTETIEPSNELPF